MNAVLLERLAAGAVLVVVTVVLYLVFVWHPAS